ncbi:MAG: FAD-dependent oxidoreductase [Actinobacteria bacterium]|nr:FAD-dependent oxidoreductase [Actinomycetota bacterium]
MIDVDVEVVVVGAGVMGLAAARSLALAGREVALVEQFRVGHDRGSSHGGSRIFRLSYPDTQWVQLAQAALPLWHELEAEAGETLIERHGSLDLGDWRANSDALAANGISFEILSGAEIGRRFPLEARNGETGLFQADGGIVRADTALRALLAGAVGAGARVLEETCVNRIEHDRDGVVISAGGSSLRARAVVVTAGAWARGLVQPLGIDLPVVPTRETVSYFGITGCGPVPSVIDPFEGRGPGQLGYALAAPGVGLKAGIHHTGETTDPNAPGEVDERLAEWTADWIGRRFVGVNPLARAETCLYTNTADERFLLQHVGRVVVGSACSGHGFKFAPVVGQRLARFAAELLTD